MRPRRCWVGVYALCCAFGQLGLYLAGSAGMGTPVDLDPRFALYVVESLFDPRTGPAPGVARGTSAVALEAAAWWMWRGGSAVPYLAIEALCSAPLVLFAAMILWANSSPAHGFSIPELGRPILVFFCFSAVPGLAAWRLARREYGLGAA